MKTIVIEVEDEIGNVYDDLTLENKKKFLYEVESLMKKAVSEDRVAKLRKIIEDIKNDPEPLEFSPHILIELTRM